VATVKVRSLHKRFGDYAAIRGAELDVRDGEFVTLLGESGCGKTTTLRCIAGLEAPDDGHIAIGSSVVFDGQRKINLPPERRQTGMVFQSYALWPHMTVLENVVYPLRMRGMARQEARRQAMDILRTVGLESLVGRSATSVSGGQQQRIALARALVSRPQLMLYDEPLSNLDPSLRRMMRDEILRLHRLNGTTSVYVTHDLEEAMHLSDRVVVMESGLFEQSGSPVEIYTTPANEFVARFVGFENILPAEVLDSGERLTVRFAGSDSVIAVPATTYRPARGASVSVAFRAAHVTVARPEDRGTGSSSAIRATITKVTYLGPRTEYEASAGALSIRIVQGESKVRLSAHPPREGETVDLTIDSQLCALMPTGRQAAAPPTDHSDDKSLSAAMLIG
jgi:iron(III) transport system ATP-binding protein